MSIADNQFHVSVFTILFVLLIGTFQAGFAESVIQLHLKSPYYKYGETILVEGRVVFQDGYAIGTQAPRGLPVSIELYDPIGNVVFVEVTKLTEDMFVFSIKTGDGTKIIRDGKYTLIAYYGAPNKNLLNTAHSTSAQFLIRDASQTSEELTPQLINDETSEDIPQENLFSKPIPKKLESSDYAWLIMLPIIAIFVVAGLVVRKRKSSGEYYSRTPTHTNQPHGGETPYDRSRYDKEEYLRGREDEQRREEEYWRGREEERERRRQEREFERQERKQQKEYDNIEKSFTDGAKRDAKFAHDFFEGPKRKHKKRNDNDWGF